MYTFLHTYKKRNGGSIILLALVFGSIFMMLSMSLAGLVLVQKKAQAGKEASERALEIAEAGLEYYKWYLAHYPNDLTNGTGLPGPYVHSYSDPETGTVGSFSLTVEGEESCGITTSVRIVSTGTSDADPLFKRVVSAKYAQPSVASYAYILNSNVWVGDDQEIYGPYHSNGGIHMDGVNHSTVSSAVSTWQCTDTYGCSGTETKSGIFGGGPNTALWNFPTPPVDFAGISIDLSTMKDAVQNYGGIYLHPIGSGYHVILKDDGTVDIYQVQSTRDVWKYTVEDGWERDQQLIRQERFIENDPIPPGCPVIFAEDDIWLEGVVKGKISVVSAKVTSPSIDTRILLSGDLTYDSYNGSDGITVVAEDSVLLPLLVPDDMEINGIFLAQKGYFGRDHYVDSGTHAVPPQYSSYIERNSLSLHGSVVSNKSIGTKWVCGGVYCSGFENRTSSYDRNLAADPPPLTPNTSGDFRFAEWREED